MGFASGYVVGQRDATPAPRSAERAVARNQAPLAGERIDEDKPAATDGRDFTESTVPPAAPAAPRVAPRDEAEPTPRGTREEAAAFGVLQVESRPRGARVFVDGRLVGTTPMVLSEIRPGTHAVRIDLSGYRRWVTTVDVAPGERQRVAASLER